MIHKPSLEIGSIEIISRKELDAIKENINNTFKDYSSEKTILDLFKTIVYKKTGNTALIYKDEKLTYGQLDTLSNKIANFLQGDLYRHQSYVTVMINHCFELFISYLGVVKVGKAFVPIDVKWPEKRVLQVVEQLGSRLVLTVDNNREMGNSYQGIDFFDVKDLLSGEGNEEFCSSQIKKNDKIYAIFTSGTTGIPKAAINTHKGLLNRLLWMNDFFGKQTSQRVYQSTRYIYDSSVWQFFWPLINGNVCVIQNPDYDLAGNSIFELIEKYNITIVDFVPSVFYYLNQNSVEADNIVDKLKTLDSIILGGAAIDLRSTLEFKKSFPRIRIFNLYGPTETCIGVTAYEVTGNESRIPLGKPISNTEILILNDNGKILPRGLRGRLHIGGVPVGLGYVNDSERTGKTFVSNPYNKKQIIYDTGDLGAYGHDNNIEFHGRNDNQVKINGHRIELSEIDNCIVKHQNITRALSIVHKINNSPKICCYLIIKNKITDEEITGYLKAILPEYMVPTFFIRVDEFPVQPSGKINNALLPLPTINQHELTIPETVVQIKLARIWQKVLKIDYEQIYQESDFFESGGDSIKAVILNTYIRQQFNVKLHIGEIFDQSRFNELAGSIENKIVKVLTKIDKAYPRQYYNLTSTQTRLYFLNQLYPESSVYNISKVFLLKGIVDKDRIESVFDFLVQRHESFRTFFIDKEEKPVQVIDEDVTFKLDFQKSTWKDVENVIREYIKPFDLAKSPLLRVGMIELSDDESMLIVDTHHIVTDGVSQDILVKEFISVYNGENLPVLPLNYKDYAEWQKGEDWADSISSQKEFWINEFSGKYIPLDLPTDFRRPGFMSYEGGSREFYISPGQFEDLKKLALQEKSTVFMILFSVFNIFLHKISHAETITVGTPVAGRNHPDIDNIIGLFVNTLPITTRIKKNEKFTDLLCEVKNKVVNCIENQNYPLDELIEDLKLSGNTGYNPLFDVVFVYQNYEHTEMKLPGLEVIPYPFSGNTSKFDLTFTVKETSGGLLLQIEYSKDLYTPQSIGCFANIFKKLLSSVIEKPESSIFELEILPEEDSIKILNEFNGSETSYPSSLSIIDLFEVQTECNGNRKAVSDKRKYLDYTELNRRANKIGHYLIENNLNKRDVVGLVGEKNIDTVAAMIGILKAGCTYLPINPDLPYDRISYMLEDCGARILLTHGGVKKLNFQVKQCDLNEMNLIDFPENNPTVEISPDDGAYIIYTSGTTGKPKGALVSHGNVVRLLFNDKFQFDFDENDKWSLFHSFGFDFSVWEMYGALLRGGEAVVISKEDSQDMSRFARTLKENGITVLNQTPSAFYKLSEEVQDTGMDLSFLKYLIFGGEELRFDKIAYWKSRFPRTRMINMYGITETTVHVTYKEIENEDLQANLSNIGRAIPTTTLYIFDENMRIQPFGIPGEIYVGGKEVCKGYIKRDKLNKEKFLPNPYRPVEILYKSGDNGKMLPSGEVIYLGRKDKQVQIRGFRIEKGEIESVVRKLEGIRDVHISDKKLKDDQLYLIAYIKSDMEIQQQEIKNMLKKSLPDYMIPSYIIRLDQFPLTVNGKLDENKLPLPSINDVPRKINVVKPVSKTEILLYEIWEDILPVSEFGITENFFDLGGGIHCCC